MTRNLPLLEVEIFEDKVKISRAKIYLGWDTSRRIRELIKIDVSSNLLDYPTLPDQSQLITTDLGKLSWQSRRSRIFRSTNSTKCQDRGALQFPISIFVEIRECYSDQSRPWLIEDDVCIHLSDGCGPASWGHD